MFQSLVQPLQTFGGGIQMEGPAVVAGIVVVAMIVMIGFVVFLALGPGTQPYQGEQAEPTPTDDAGIRDANPGQESGSGSDSSTDSRSG